MWALLWSPLLTQMGQWLALQLFFWPQFQSPEVQVGCSRPCAFPQGLVSAGTYSDGGTGRMEHEQSTFKLSTLHGAFQLENPARKPSAVPACILG